MFGLKIFANPLFLLKKAFSKKSVENIPPKRRLGLICGRLSVQNYGMILLD